jgi:hypothetical protein
MATPIADKLRIKPGYSLLGFSLPADFIKSLGPLPGGVTVSGTTKKYDQVHWFVKSKSQVEKEMGHILKLVKPGITVWVYYPKGTSGIQTDLTRDKGWDSLLKEGYKLTWISLVSFDDTWSVFGFRSKTEEDRKKEDRPKVREIFNWVNPKTKEITLPDDLAAALKKDKKAAGYFDTLSFSNKKEYIEWIVTAKRPETRTERIKGTTERLNKSWKNPRNI